MEVLRVRGSAAMLAARRSAGVTLGGNLKGPSHTGDGIPN